MSLRDGQCSRLPARESLDDADLVIGARAGDRRCREMLYRKHARYLLAVASRLLASRSEGEEIVQDAFVLAFQHLQDLREPGAVRAWLTQIGISLVRRRLRRERFLRFLGFDPGPPDAALAALAAPGLSADDHAELALIDKLLARLPIELHIAWMLRRVEGLGLVEVACACNCSLATAKRRIAAADAMVSRHVAIAEKGL